jgi:hypothetical protein
MYIPDPNFFQPESWIPDPKVKKAPDPGSATLHSKHKSKSRSGISFTPRNAGTLEGSLEEGCRRSRLSRPMSSSFVVLRRCCCCCPTSPVCPTVREEHVTLHPLLRIRDPDFFPSRTRIFSIPDPGPASKNLSTSILTQKRVSKLSEIRYDPGC